MGKFIFPTIQIQLPLKLPQVLKCNKKTSKREGKAFLARTFDGIDSRKQRHKEH